MNWIIKFYKKDKAYFASNKKNIVANNKVMLVKACILYVFVLFSYSIFMTVANQPHIIRNMYYVYDIIHLVLCTVVFIYYRYGNNSDRMIQALCIAFEISLLSFFLLEGVLCSKTEHSLYFPIPILLILLIFTNNAVYTMTTIILYVTVFAFLTYIYKVPAAFFKDLQVSVATFVSATVGYILIANLKYAEADALNKFEMLSKIDQSTGLLNKESFKSICSGMLKKDNYSCALIIIDLDNFKAINDKYGHDVGDEVLGKIGSAMKESFRNSDFVGRFGGDEFIVLMNDCNNEKIIIERIKLYEMMVNEMKFSEIQLKVGCSIGVAVREQETEFDKLFKRADEALYKSKIQGKGKCTIG